MLLFPLTTIGGCGFRSAQLTGEKSVGGLHDKTGGIGRPSQENTRVGRQLYQVPDRTQAQTRRAIRAPRFFLAMRPHRTIRELIQRNQRWPWPTNESKNVFSNTEQSGSTRARPER